MCATWLTDYVKITKEEHNQLLGQYGWTEDEYELGEKEVEVDLVRVANDKLEEKKNTHNLSLVATSAVDYSLIVDC